ncbi:histidine kinase [Oceanobacillus sp. E9]|uniref:sensor histidine kinase n=1 Tax=Oceanobacillus TaxID=182709 RepID=UPI00084E6557|nr:MULTISPECIES: sensor histidine kinase [Oceanobacillus]OEH53293.1 histidine kinase [Oceanobacillus sp. E9]
MIFSYMKERISWIILFLALQLTTLIVGYIDMTIPMESIYYIIFIQFIIGITFFIVRYRKETKFYKELMEWKPEIDLIDMPEGDTLFSRVVTNALEDQSQIYREEYNQLQLDVRREKDDLLVWIHEVKTPLTTMQLMLERVEDKELRSQLSYEWLRIHLLLDQQLHQRRIPFMKNDLYIENVDLESIINEEIRTLRSWCMQKGIGFQIELNITQLLSDAKWLHFILRQLITNAVKYSEKNDITIRSLIMNNQNILYISDKGRGIPAKDLPRIFEKGFTSTKEHFDQSSSGMGLYLAKQAADSLGIKIEVSSEWNRGTCFQLIFPKKNDLLHITSM